MPRYLTNIKSLTFSYMAATNELLQLSTPIWYGHRDLPHLQ